MSTRTPHLNVALIGAAFLLLAGWYSVGTPILEPYDERYHFAYVLSIALDHALPAQNVEQVGPWGNEGSQPPLYYLLTAAATFWAARPGFEQQIERNPYTTRHLPVEPDNNRNIYIHRRAEDFPYDGNVLVLHVARLLSGVFGLGAVAGTYLFVRQLFPATTSLAICATAFLAFIPSFIYVSSSVNNDNLVVCLAAFSLWACVRLLRAARVTLSDALLLGALLGLATLAKLSALPLLGVGLLTVYWAVGGRARFNDALARCAALLCAFLALTGWWFARNVWLYGELLGTNTMNQIAGLRPQVATLPDVLAELPQIERTFWAAFGTGNVHPDDVWLWLPRALAIIGAIGCIAASRRLRMDWRLHDVNSRIVFLCALWVAVFVATYVWWLFRITSVTGRLLFPLLPVLTAAMAFGLSALAARWRSVILTASACGMGGLAALMPILVIGPSYARPPTVSAEQIAQVETRSDAVFGEGIRLLAYHVREREAELGKPIHVDLYWQALKPLMLDYTVYAHVLGAEDKAIGGMDTLPGRGSFPTTDWMPNAIYKDTIAVYLDELPAEPLAAILIVGWYETASQKGLTPRASDGKRLGRVDVGRVRVPSLTAPSYRPSLAASANFGDQIELVGYDVRADAVTLYWRARQPLMEDYTAFVHILDDAERLVAQADGQPRGGAYPTSYWRAGEIVRDEHPLALPTPNAKITVGWYRLDTGARLP
ncbi:MAG: glycosyltransferase family 39 protein, partial [Chloroflexota bacterium]